MALAGDVRVVTGASQGIGQGVAILDGSWRTRPSTN